MKRAKRVEVPLDSTLGYDEFCKLRSHAFNSAMWYATERALGSGMIREKLLRKGYPEGSVSYVDEFGETREHDFIEDTLRELEDRHLLNDDEFSRSLMETMISRGYGSIRIRMEMRLKKVPEETIDTLLDEDNSEALEDGARAVARRAMKNYKYRKLEGNEFARKMYLKQTLMTKGYTSADIEFLDDEDFEDS